MLQARVNRTTKNSSRFSLTMYVNLRTHTFPVLTKLTMLRLKIKNTTTKPNMKVKKINLPRIYRKRRKRSKLKLL